MHCRFALEDQAIGGFVGILTRSGQLRVIVDEMRLQQWGAIDPRRQKNSIFPSNSQECLFPIANVESVTALAVIWSHDRATLPANPASPLNLNSRASLLRPAC
jgi:hypothetical protein